VWEVSVSAGWRAGDPTPIRYITQPTRLLLKVKVQQLAEGVGDHERGFWHTDRWSLHFRWPLTDDEMAQLPDGWLACPAVDRGGREDEMTREPPW